MSNSATSNVSEHLLSRAGLHVDAETGRLPVEIGGHQVAIEIVSTDDGGILLRSRVDGDFNSMEPAPTWLESLCVGGPGSTEIRLQPETAPLISIQLPSPTVATLQTAVNRLCGLTGVVHDLLSLEATATAAATRIGQTPPKLPDLSPAIAYLEEAAAEAPGPQADPAGQPSLCAKCGLAYAPGADFCSACGSSLATQASVQTSDGAGPVQPLTATHMPAPPFASSAEWAQVKRPPGARRKRPNLASRPLTASESAQLNRLQRTSGIRTARRIAVVAGLVSLGLSLNHMRGVLYPGEVFLVLIGLMLATTISSTIAFRSVKPPRDALRYGRAIEINGIATSSSGLAKWLRRSVRMGPVEIVFPRGQASLVTLSQQHAFVVALGLKAAKPSRMPNRRWPRGIVLEIDGTPVTTREIIYLRW